MGIANIGKNPIFGLIIRSRLAISPGIEMPASKIPRLIARLHVPDRKRHTYLRIVTFRTSHN
jgi:hypothetical protein